jgi:Protein of unknown function (DUF3375)
VNKWNCLIHDARRVRIFAPPTHPDTVQQELIERLFKQTNALQLLRDSRAEIVLSFLKMAFSDGRKSIGQEELTRLLAGFLTNFNEKDVFDEQEAVSADLFDRYRNRAKSMLRDWESSKKRYLRGDNNAEGVYEYSLTEHVVRAWQWLESLEQREFAGTRSRLDDIFEKIRRVVENSREKTDAERIAELEQKQREIDEEIAAIKSGKRPYQPFDNTRLREEYDGMLEQIRALSTDFKAVEGHFERIRSEMLRQQAGRQGSKGMLLGSALDARDALDRTPQGLSFNGFFQELRDPARIQQFESRSKEFLSVLASRQIEHPNSQLLLRLYRHLLGEAQPVLEANRRIADRITRIVAENATQDRQLLRERIAAVKALLLEPDFLQKNLDSNSPVWEIDSDVATVVLPLEKALKTRADEQQLGFALPEKSTDEKPELAFNSEAAILIRLEKQLEAALALTDEETLAQLLETYPLEKGLAEILAYLNLVAQANNRHFIQPKATDIVVLNEEKGQFLEGPRVFFVRDKNNR